MKRSKLLAALMLAGLCGISEAEATSHRGEIKSLEKQRAHYQQEHSESMERLRELDFRARRRTIDEDDEDEVVGDDEGEMLREDAGLKIAESTPMNRDLVQEREVEAARAKVAAKEMAKIDKAIRKEKARERERRVEEEFGLPR
jgi:hypothetical protein